MSSNHHQIFDYLFKKASETHSHSTRHATAYLVFLPQAHINEYGKFSMTYQNAFTWNDLENKPGTDMLEESNSKSKLL